MYLFQKIKQWCFKTVSTLLGSINNSFFNSIDYGYKIVDGKVNFEIFNKESRSGCFAVCYDYEDKVVLNLYGMYRIVINDITFEKII